MTVKYGSCVECGCYRPLSPASQHKRCALCALQVVTAEPKRAPLYDQTINPGQIVDFVIADYRVIANGVFSSKPIRITITEV